MRPNPTPCILARALYIPACDLFLLWLWHACICCAMLQTEWPFFFFASSRLSCPTYRENKRHNSLFLRPLLLFFFFFFLAPLGFTLHWLSLVLVRALTLCITAQSFIMCLNIKTSIHMGFSDCATMKHPGEERQLPLMPQTWYLQRET